MSEDWSLATEDGRVVVYLPRAFSAEIDATTGDGRVRADLDLDESSREGNGRRELRGRIGAGGHTLRIRTASGSISLRPS
jgi:DUF4097 and DUF4098 domain-containing protein YvlB